ncbi:MAG TPA: hypothetical protein VFC70_03225 [Oscillospiraceae bacterium]|nr:hypothetical protein [Oscillospiraceae bacterium]
MEKIKDFFHDFSDIFFAIVIAGIMFTVLALNLGNWFDDFPSTTLASEPAGTSEEQNNIVNKKQDNDGTDSKNDDNRDDNRSETKDSMKKDSINRTETEKPENNESQSNENTDSNTNETDQKNKTQRDTKKITIPNGTFGTGVAKILKESGLINDINDFVRAAENLNLSSRLKSGSFEIPTDATVEDMAKIIAGQKNM